MPPVKSNLELELPDFIDPVELAVDQHELEFVFGDLEQKREPLTSYELL